MTKLSTLFTKTGIPQQLSNKSHSTRLLSRYLYYYYQLVTRYFKCWWGLWHVHCSTWISNLLFCINI